MVCSGTLPYTYNNSIEPNFIKTGIYIALTMMQTDEFLCLAIKMEY